MMKWEYGYLDVTGLELKFWVIDCDDDVHVETIISDGYFAIRKCDLFGLKCQQILAHSDNLGKVDWFYYMEV